ncbi:hypothetical protein HDU67_005301 [Dinochytrium kinnereticum]|nr:hypothetical protein HDU67_005301 [Dinochytrium kinnereticum]
MKHSVAIAIISALCMPFMLLASAQAYKREFTQRQVERWKGLRIRALDITDEMCSSDILDTLEDAHFTYLESGLSEKFMDALFSVRDVSGDVPEAAVFRSQLLVAFNDFAGSIGYNGNPLTNKTFSYKNLLGISKPRFYGHKAVAADDAGSPSPNGTKLSGAQMHSFSALTIFGALCLCISSVLF